MKLFTVMRLGKKKEKERDPESKFQVAEGIHRLVCSCKTAQAPLKGNQSNFFIFNLF